ncbi:TIGR02300 family protein [Methylobacterium sp. NFXW15]|uniref:TIGR02300 family protein n=1 Tax=Methylobacterium sp. NFXW15 TaxID=2819512 RepID=UPI003CF3189C
MPRPELGNKLTCPTTGRKFYDLGRSPVVSPYSGEIVPIAAAVTSRGRYAAPVAARREEPADEEDEQEGPELVSLDEVEDDGKDGDADAEGDDALVIEDDGDEDTATDDERFVVDDEDEESPTGLVDVDEDEES